MKKILSIFTLLTSLLIQAQNSIPYENSSVVKISDLTPEIELALSQFDVNYLSCRHQVNNSDVILSQEALAWLSENEVEFELLVSNLKQKIDHDNAVMASLSAQKDGEAWYSVYRTFDEIQDKLDVISSSSTIASLINLGTSYEGNAIKGIKLSTGGSDKPAVFFNGCQHAREWISPMATVYLADFLTQNYSTDILTQSVLEAVDVYIVPVVNPDGYIYSHTDERYWRKNRQPNEGSTCIGTDLNRNWDADWNGGQSTSTSPCSDTYVGTAAFSATEAQVLKSYMELIPNLVGHIDIHSYSALVLGPWGYSNSPTPDHAEVVSLGNNMNDAITNTHNYDFIFGVGDANGNISLASGTMPDWSYDVLNAYGYTYELRPSSWSGGGFELPISQILDACEENYNGVFEMISWAASNSSTSDSQVISLPIGWYIFSTYIQPENPAMDSLLSPVANSLVIAKNGEGLAYLPDWGFNGIGDLIDGEGYLVKLNTALNLPLSGTKIQPETFEMSFETGWNMFGYLRDSSANLVDMLAPIQEQIVIVKTFDGTAYLPDWGFNGIGNMTPGEGYQIKVTSDVIFSYPAN